MPNLDSDGDFLNSSEKWLNSHRWQTLSALVGLIFVGGGIFLFGADFFEQPKVEVLGVESQGDMGNQGNIGAEITVEISGAVEKPGVYKLASNSRVDDLFIAAGGLSSSADRGYVEKNVNRAGKLIDGQKIYVPKVGAGYQSAPGSALGSAPGEGVGVSNKININSASLKELDSLSGIGEVRAQAIVDNRPYGTIDELISRKVIPKSVYDKIKDNIIAQ